ncbi:hypothetical protein EV121DRAFT_201641 [Schizophyllum commune]
MCSMTTKKMNSPLLAGSKAGSPIVGSPASPALPIWQGLLNGQEKEMLNTNASQSAMSPSNFFSTIDFALEIQVERARTLEVLRARDAVIVRLSEAYTKLHEKTVEVERLQDTLNRLLPDSPTQSSAITSKIAQERQQLADMQKTIDALREEIRVLKLAAEEQARAQPPPKYEARLPLAPPAPPIRRHSGSVLSSGSGSGSGSVTSTLLDTADDPKVRLSPYMRPNYG